MHFTASYPIMMFCMYFGRSLLILLKDVKMSLLTCGCSNFSSVWCCERWFYDTVMPLARRCKGPESLQLKDKFLGRSSRPLRPSELQRNSLFCTKVIEMARKLGIDKAQLPRKRIHPKVEQKKVNSWQLLKIGFNKTEFATVVEGCHSEVECFGFLWTVFTTQQLECQLGILSYTVRQYPWFTTRCFLCNGLRIEPINNSEPTKEGHSRHVPST